MKKRDYASSSQKMAGNEQIAAEVAKNPNGIGYVGLAYTHAPGIRVVGIVGKDKIAVLPSNQTVQAKTYPYARPTFFYTNGEPSGLTAEFVDFMLGAEGQAQTFQNPQQFVLGHIGRAVEGHMLHEVGQTQLVLVLHQRTGRDP